MDKTQPNDDAMKALDATHRHCEEARAARARAGGLASEKTLRDYFAGQALTGLVAFPGMVNGSSEKRPDSLAGLAYDLADAMIAERNKQP